jgi:hypothetical protein
MKKLDIKEISKMENVMQSVVDKVNSFKYVVFYGLGFALKWDWQRYLEWFGRPAAIIDRAVKTGEQYEGVPLFASVSELPDDILNNCVILVTVISVREEVCAELEKYIEKERVVKYPTLLTFNSKYYRDFIVEHAEAISKFYDTLEDEQSKRTFEDWLKGKVTCDISWFCRNCVPGNYVNVQEYPLEMLREKGYTSDLYYRRELRRQAPNDSLFLTGIWEWRDDEVYFDCGAAHGDTYLGFVSAVKGRYQNIVLFEPEERVYEQLKSFVGEASGVVCIMSGVSDKDTEIYTGANSQMGGLSSMRKQRKNRMKRQERKSA